MFTITPGNGLEKFLCDKARETKTPISGTFELLPVCNMDCSMCYIRISREEMLRQGTPMSVDQWLHIGGEAARLGCMFLTLTGGEPLLYPDFGKLYDGLRGMGIIITLNTNGTLLNKEHISLFKHNPPRRMNVSLYGASDAKYAEMCHNPKGYTQVMNGIRMLLDAGIEVKINFTPTPQNRSELDAVVAITEELGIPISTPTYMFPPVRKPGTVQGQKVNRLTPQEAAYEQLRIICKAWHGRPDYKEHIQSVLDDMKAPESSAGEAEPPQGFLCAAGKSNFWVDWKGNLSPCGMVMHLSRSLKQMSFSEAWEAVKADSERITTSKKCFNCRFRKTCQACPASSYAETGQLPEPTPYQCELVAEYERLLKEHLQELEKES